MDDKIREKLYTPCWEKEIPGDDNGQKEGDGESPVPNRKEKMVLSGAGDEERNKRQGGVSSAVSRAFTSGDTTSGSYGCAVRDTVKRAFADG